MNVPGTKQLLLLASSVAPIDLLLQMENSSSPPSVALGNMMYLGALPPGEHSALSAGSCCIKQRKLMHSQSLKEEKFDLQGSHDYGRVHVRP